MLQCMSLLLAQSGHHDTINQCPLLGVKRTSVELSEMSAIERHETGPRMSKAVIHGDTVYLAGIVADSPKGKSMAEQTRSILSQIDSFLATAGTDKTKLLSANIWITDMANFAEMNSVWDTWVSPGNTPARATVEAKLASPDYKVEIMVVAAR
jgi:enamine deaminase RidA (YjgF/YER057c/UK114 family)